MKIELDVIKDMMKENNPEQYAKLYPNEETIPEQIAEPIIQAFETLAKATVASDKSIMDVVHLLSARVFELEKQVDMLMELHRMGDE